MKEISSKHIKSYGRSLSGIIASLTSDLEKLGLPTEEVVADLVTAQVTIMKLAHKAATKEFEREWAK